MSTILEDKLWHYPSLVITEAQLAQLLSGTSDSYQARIKRAVAKQQLIRLKRGVFLLGKRLVSKTVSLFELAQFIDGLSYISFESAMSYHGLIPEAVYMTTSACISRNKLFKSVAGDFVYYKLPMKNFFIEVKYVEVGENQFLMASPWKALLDYIYCDKFDWKNFSSILESLRIEDEMLPKITKTHLENLKSYYHSKRMNIFIDNISGDLMT